MLKKKFLAIGLIVVFAANLMGCSASSSETASTAQTDAENVETDTADEAEVQTIKVAVPSNDKPKAFIDEDGTISGYDVEVLKKVDELLPQYEFVFEAMDFESLIVGVETGAYEIGSDSLMKTEEREEKFLFPDVNLGVTVTKMVMRADQENLDTLDDVVKYGYKLVPMPANSGTYAVILAYNEEHPDAPVEVDNIESLDRVDAYQWIIDGRYDAFVTTIDGHAVTAEGMGVADQLKLSDTVLASTPTYCILNKDQTELTAAVSDALAQLKADGTLSALSTEWLGEDVFLAE